MLLRVDPALDLGSRLLTTVARLNRWATRQAVLPDSTASLRTLALIDELGDARLGDLARADHCSQPTMTGQVTRLADAGWVRRTPDPADARAVRVALTDAGAERLRTVRARRADVLRPALARLSDDERRILAAAAEILARLTSDTTEEAAPR